MISHFLLSIFLLFAVHSVSAELYVNHPLPTDTCTGGQPCTVQWLDDGKVPLLGEIGVTTVGLYHGNQSLVQTIQPVDVSRARSLQFIPDPQAGPDANIYYICFTSLTLKNSSNSTVPYQGFSPPFRLTGMRGSFASPVASLTATLPIPSTVASAPPATIQSTTTVGGPITDIPTITSSSRTVPVTSASPSASVATSASSSGFITSVVPTSSSAPPTTTTASSSVSNAAANTQLQSALAFGSLLALGLFYGTL